MKYIIASGIMVILACVFFINKGVTEVKKDIDLAQVIEEAYLLTDDWLIYQKPVYDEVDILFMKFNVPYEYQDFTRQVCELQNVETSLLVSFIQIESVWGRATGYNSNAYYRRYGLNKQYADIGLGQINSRYNDYFEEYFFNPELLFSLGYKRTSFKATDPYCNIQVAAAYLSYLYKKFGSYELATKAYNCGPGTVSYGVIPEVTHRYSYSIMNGYSSIVKEI